jgi:hypothetical protein
MGIKGVRSRRGVGEKDGTPRLHPIYFKCTPHEAALLAAASEIEQKTKADILITLIRTHLSKYAQYLT